MPSESINEERAEKYLQLQLLGSQIKQAQSEFSALEQKKAEMSALISSLAELKQTKPKTALLSPLGLGVYVTSQLEDSGELFVNVGAGVVVKKKLDEVREIINKQVVQFEELSADVMQKLQMMVMQAQAMESELGE